MTEQTKPRRSPRAMDEVLRQMRRDRITALASRTQPHPVPAGVYAAAAVSAMRDALASEGGA